MLVLSRKIGERVLIGENIVVTIVRVQGNGVRIGIEAPPEMAVVREELQQRMHEENAASPAQENSLRLD